MARHPSAPFSDPTINTFVQVWDRLQQELRSIADQPRRFRQQARLERMLARIEREIARLDPAALEWARNQAPAAYRTGARLGAGRDLPWSVLNREAVELATNQAYEELLTRSRLVFRTTRRLIRQIGQEQVIASVVEGRTAVQASREMRQWLQARQVHAVTYSNGARVGLGQYSEMIIRTVTGNLYNRGTLDGASAEGVKYFEVFDSDSCGWVSHDDAEPARGKIVTADEAASFPLSHPNCVRALGPRPDITSKKKAARAKPIQDETIFEDPPLAQRTQRNRHSDALARHERRVRR